MKFTSLFNGSASDIPDKIKDGSKKESKKESEYVKELESMPPLRFALATFILGCSSAVITSILYRRYGQRIRTTDWITPDMLAKKRWIRGVVTSVGDADNFRLFHTPAFGGWRWPLKIRRVPKTNKELKDETLHVRIAGIDAPEAAHFGKPGQPYAAESLAWLRNKILGKPVYCQLIRRDQYSRVVCNVHLAPRFLPGALFYGKSLPIEMLKAGWVTTYEQAGAEYGREGKARYLRVEAQARRARRGMWAGKSLGETPAEYKRRHSSSPLDGNKPPKTQPRKTIWN